MRVCHTHVSETKFKQLSRSRREAAKLDLVPWKPGELFSSWPHVYYLLKQAQSIEHCFQGKVLPVRPKGSRRPPMTHGTLFLRHALRAWLAGFYRQHGC